MHKKSLPPLLVVLLFSLHSAVATSAEVAEAKVADRIFIVPSSGSTCPGLFTGEPCLTLLQYFTYVHRIYLNTAPSNIVLELQPGKHDLNRRNLEIQSLDRILIRGKSATIDCFNHDLAIRSVQYVHISDITFLRCRINAENLDELVVEDSHYQSLSQLRITNTNATKIVRSSFSGGDQTLRVSMTNVEVSQSSFRDNRMAIHGYDSNITLHQCSFRLNSLTTTLRYRTSGVINVYNGGAIHLWRNTRYPNTVTLQVFDTEFYDNTVGNKNSRGGAIYARNVNITVNGSIFNNSTAEENGGAISLDGNSRRKQVVIYLSNFTNNHAESGGAIYLRDETLDIQITKSFFVNNTATSRGGGAVDSIGRLNLLVEESFFSQNSAAFCGVFNFDSYRFSNTMKLTQSTFTFNQAKGGSDIRFTLRLQGRRDNIGGVACIRNATISILNSNFSHNSVAGYGGVLHVDDSMMTIKGSNFDNNTAQFDGGVTYTEFYRVQMKISQSNFSSNQAQHGSGGALYMQRYGCQVEISRSSFSYNNANNRGGVIAIFGGLLEAKQTNFYNNTAELGDIASSCNSGVSLPDELISINDTNHAFCTLYNGFIDHFNTTATLEETSTTYSPIVGSTTTTASGITEEATTTSTAFTDETTTLSTTTSTPTSPPSDTSTTAADVMPLIITGPLTVYFELNGEIYINNSVVPLTKVGEEDGALFCRTNREACCGTLPNRYGEFYYPNGDLVSINSREQDYYRNRGNRHIRLNRRLQTVSPTGRFRCVIPDAQGVFQTVYIHLI